MENNKFIAQPFVPKTETRIVLENKEPSKLVQVASYLGISTANCCGRVFPIHCIVDGKEYVVESDRAKIVYAAQRTFNEVASQYGGNVTTKVEVSKSGNCVTSITVTYKKN